MKYSDSLRRATTRRDNIHAETWADERFAEQRDRDLADHAVDAKQVVAALVVCALVALLLSSQRLVDMAESRPFGDQRTVLLTSAEGVDRVANFLSLNRPADLVADLRGGTDAGRSGDNLSELAEQFDVSREPVISTTIPVATTVAPTVPDDASTVDPPPTTSSVVVTTTRPTPTRRAVTVDDPLPALVVGDSQAEIVGQSLIETAANAGRVVEVSVEAEVATGLARPDDFNWPRKLLELVERDDTPELVMLMMGGNDDWDMEVAGERLEQGTTAWIEEYRFRVSLLTDIATAQGAHAMWVLYPPIRDGARDAVIDDVNAAVIAAVSGREDASIFDAHTLFATAEGGYEVFFENDLGATRRMRADDGVHFTRSGSNWLSRELYADLAGIWEFAPLE